jgi:hypothetical protein
MCLRQLSWAWNVFNHLYLILKVVIPLVDLRFTDTRRAMFGQHFRIYFRQFSTFCTEQSDGRSSLMFGARLHRSRHLFNTRYFGFYPQLALFIRTLLPVDFTCNIKVSFAVPY